MINIKIEDQSISLRPLFQKVIGYNLICYLIKFLNNDSEISRCYITSGTITKIEIQYVVYDMIKRTSATHTLLAHNRMKLGIPIDSERYSR